MKISSSIIIIFLLTKSICSQTVQDFSITDSDGINHSLYEDHLDQGKTVVIKLFFTTCPPCIAIAPNVQALYEDWGEGDYDVEFLELSTQSFDSNADVANYKNQHNLTFPGVGSDGGSTTATAQFTSGTFGMFWGTPTFAVIEPDGNVIWNVNFNDLDATIAATGANGGNNTPPPSALYILDFISPSGNSILPINSEIFIKSLSNNSTEVNITPYLNNNLSFNYPSAEIPLIESPYLIVKNENNPTQNITVTDILILQKHLLQKDTIKNQFLLDAADVSNNGSLSVKDQLELLKLLLGKTQKFPNKSSWSFLFPDCNNCEEYIIDNTATGIINVDIVAIKNGDLNNQ